MNFINNIRKKIFLLIKEAVALDHVVQRFQDRFLSTRIMGVGIEISPGKYDEVGTYIINDQIINELKTKFEILTKKKFPKNKDYGIKILDIVINPNDIQYFNIQDKIKYSNTKLYKHPFILLNNSAHDSNGNSVYAIIRGGEIVTIMLAKNYVPITPDKLKVDFVIKNWELIVQNKVR